ncbi:hypothetical protein GUJ93_ZPchr0011g28211 [Zizania palustris]|uniref:Secreted protein n=1 Tax=Zizania palustris TaxID=103762 RepID=A0A8J5WIB8_ZIZPA|nr:hypothetical protein GUJ93_ZPchr0011g28211 [Zizania palustris]
MKAAGNLLLPAATLLLAIMLTTALARSCGGTESSAVEVLDCSLQSQSIPFDANPVVRSTSRAVKMTATTSEAPSQAPRHSHHYDELDQFSGIQFRSQSRAFETAWFGLSPPSSVVGAILPSSAMQAVKTMK